MKTLLKNKTLIVGVVAYILLIAFALYTRASNDIQNVGEELSTLRAEWQEYQNTIDEATKNKLALEPLIREKQAELDALVGKK